MLSRLKLGIATKLALLLALVGVLASGLTGFYAYEASRTLMVDSAKDKLLTSTQVLVRRISFTRDEIVRNLHVLASHPQALAVLQRWDTGAADGLATLFALMMKANPAYFQIRLIAADDFGMERVRVDRLGSDTQRVQGDDLQEKGHFAYVAETLKLPEGRVYLSRITINHETGGAAGVEQPVLQYAMPVMPAGGQALGLVVVNVDLKGLFSLLVADLPGSFSVYLANGEGDVLVHPDASRTFGFDKGRRVLIQDEFGATAALVEGRQSEVVMEAGGGSNGQPVVAAFLARKVGMASDESAIILGLAQPLDEVLEQSRRLGVVTLQIVGGLCLLCVLLAMMLARAFTRPLNAVSVAAENFAAGLPAGALPVQRHDELGALARSFQAMQGQIAQQLADLQGQRVELEHMARHDMLTGLPNRRLFVESLERALALGRRYGTEVCVLFIDLDQFKAINDAHGHEAGDAVLSAVAGRLRAMMREVDTVARLGGDEFVVLLGAPAPELHLAAVAGKLLATVRSPVAFRGTQLQVSASIGISRSPEDGTTAEEILGSADRAMYGAKAGGRDRFHFSSVDAA